MQQGQPAYSDVQEAASLAAQLQQLAFAQGSVAAGTQLCSTTSLPVAKRPCAPNLPAMLCKGEFESLFPRTWFHLVPLSYLVSGAAKQCMRSMTASAVYAYRGIEQLQNSRT